MKTIIETLQPAPRYFTDRAKALEAHYTEGGTLYRRRDGVNHSVKPWVNGEIPDWMAAEWYEPFMVDGGRA